MATSPSRPPSRSSCPPLRAASISTWGSTGTASRCASCAASVPGRTGRWDGCFGVSIELAEDADGEEDEDRDEAGDEEGGEGEGVNADADGVD
ncbi:hypothetical protein FIBSPDRAFT_571616 [Athelia psychrophila]|uniref:Uncharacterized protein n=1 Tax=Athelia psychrophila TaxID=1759441 RepID=A0A167T9M7_9AGAM|nr:hypothetical protein FIBSPDRAFT_571616 [Fibularhizoctonia sp. CBS 109695]